MIGTAVAPSKLIGLEQALAERRDVAVQQHLRHLNPRMMQVYKFIGLDNLPVRAEGPYFWDANGRQYIDFLSAFGTLALGHNHPKLMEAVRRVQDARVPNLVEGPSRLASALAENLALLAPPGLDRVFFANSGTETVDAAIKMARAATGRPGMIACRRCFHGRSIGALSVTERPEYRENFEPLLPAVAFVDYGDVEQLAALLARKDVAGFLVEPLQGEAGMVLPPENYFSEVRRLCSRYGTLLIFDEIQTGLGRTGSLFAADHEQVIPDCLLLGKALGGGVMPLSTLLTTDELWHASKGDRPQSPFHMSTYAGNSFACAAGLACLELIFEEGLVERAAETGKYLAARLRDLQSRQPLIAAVRGRGLMIGVELAPPAILRPVTSGALGKQLQNSDARYLLSGMLLRDLITKQGLVTAITLNNADVIRVQPPLNVERETIDRFVDGVEAALAGIRNYAWSVWKSVPDIISFLRSKSVAAAYE